MTTIHSQMFTERETQVIQMLLQGKSTSQIALQLGVCTRAVELHLTHIYEKLGGMLPYRGGHKIGSLVRMIRRFGNP